jgi:uncharacterized protein (UPF0332 family)
LKPQSAQFLKKADSLLIEADKVLSVGLNEAAGRTAYLAGFHAAQALIYEHLGRALKTHNGVQTEFLQLTKDVNRIDERLRTFISRSYNLKAIADYETGPDAHLEPERAAEAIAEGKLFVAHVTKMVASISTAPAPTAKP